MFLHKGVNCGRIKSDGRTLDCRVAAGHEFDAQGQTNTQGLKITAK